MHLFKTNHRRLALALAVVFSLSSSSYALPVVNACKTLFADSETEAAFLKEWQFEPETRFMRKSVLRRSYLAPPTNVKTSTGEEVTIGIVDPKNPNISLRISNVLSRSLELAREGNGGHIPESIVTRVQESIISPKGVEKNWSEIGHRFLVTRDTNHGANQAEVLGTLVVTKDHETIFFLSGKHNNLLPQRDAAGKIQRYVDQDGNRIDRKYVEESLTSVMPSITEYKPEGSYQIANFAFLPEARNAGLSKLLLEAVMDAIEKDGRDFNDRPLFSKRDGASFWQVGEPPWQDRMKPMNFLADPSQHVYMLPPSGQSELLKTGNQSLPEFNQSWKVLEEYYVSMRTLLDRGKTFDGKPMNAELLESFRNILNEPRMEEVAFSLAQSPDELHRISTEIGRVGIKFPERLGSLYRLAVGGTAKLQYKTLDAPFSSVRSTLQKLGP